MEKRMGDEDFVKAIEKGEEVCLIDIVGCERWWVGSSEGAAEGGAEGFG